MPLFEVETDAHIIITWAENEEAAKGVVREAYPNDEVARLTKRPRDTWVISKGALGLTRTTLDPCSIARDCLSRSAGDKVNIAFSSSKPVMFEVHYHKVRSNEKIYAVEQTLLDTFEDSIIVESEEIYCCMWKNDNPDYITLTYDMSMDK